MHVIPTKREDTVAVSFPYSEEHLRTMFRNLPSRTWDSRSKTWIVPIFDLPRIVRGARMLTQSAITIDPAIRKSYDEIRERYESVAALAELKEYPELEVPGFKGELMPFQQVAVEMIRRTRRFLLAYDVGLGKTVITLAAALRLREDAGGGPFKALVVCKGSHKHRPWAELIQRFTKERFVVIEGTPKERRKLYRLAAGDRVMFVIINYEMVVQDLEFGPGRGGHMAVTGPGKMKELLEGGIGLLAMDEVVKIKNTSTKASKSMSALARKAERAIGLSGTPIKNSVMDLYGIFKVIQPALFNNYWAFSSAYCQRNFWGKVVAYKNLDRLASRIKYFSHQRQKADVLTDLPSVVINNYSADLVPSQRKALADLEASMEPDAEHPERLVDGLAAITYMREICNSARLVYEDEKDWPKEHSGKVELLKDLLEEVLADPKRKVVVFTYFERMARMLVDEFGKTWDCETITGKVSSKCSRPELSECSACDQFKQCRSRKRAVWVFWHDPKTRIIIGTDAMGEGYDLQCSDIVVNYDLPWTSAEFKQRVGRIYRIGQEARTINVVNLVCTGTVEEGIVDKINQKERLSNEVMGDWTFKNIDIRRLLKGDAVQRQEAMTGT